MSFSSEYLFYKTLVGKRFVGILKYFLKIAEITSQIKKTIYTLCLGSK